MIWSPSKDGYLKPKIKVKPVNVSGTWKQLTTGGGGGSSVSSFGLDFVDWSLPIALVPA